MASNVAGLAVSLGLDATDYFRGLTKAENEAKKFSQSFTSGMGALKGALGGLGIGLVVNEIIDLGKNIVSAAAELNDFSDQTGSSVEALSKLANQAKIAGTPFEELQNAVLKLAVGMGSAGEKGDKVASVLKTLGVTAKDPAEALQQIAVSFAKYEDGATKAAYANELFGKSGAKFLATLKDMANLQDVVSTTTKKQAEEAEQLEQAYRRIGAEATLFKNAILSDVVPALLRAITEFNEARKAGLGFWEALKLIGTGQIPVEDRIVEATKRLEEERKAFASASKFGIAGIPFAGSEEKVKNAEMRVRALTALRDLDPKLRAAEDRGFDPTRKVLPPLPEPGKGGRIAADRISDAQRYLERLQQQLQKTEELTVAETVLADIQSGRLKMSADVSKEQLIGLANQIDAANAIKKEQQDYIKLVAEEARIREQNSHMKQRGIAQLDAETAALAQGNEQLKQEIEAIGLDATSMALLTQKRLEDAAAAKDQEAAMLRNVEGMESEAAALENQARILRERKGLLTQKGVAEQIAADMAKAKEVNDIFVNSFADGVSSVVTGAKSIGEAIRNMEQQIVASISRIAAQKIGESLFGAATSSGGGGIFASIGPMIASMFGGGASSPTAFQFGRAGGGSVAANQPYMVGERGPEMFVPKTSGTIVPNEKLTTGSRGNYVFNINVPAGASRSTIDQTRLKFGMELQRVMDRNG